MLPESFPFSYFPLTHQPVLLKLYMVRAWTWFCALVEFSVIASIDTNGYSKNDGQKVRAGGAKDGRSVATTVYCILL